MFEWLFRTKAVETSDSEKRNQIQDILRENHIDYVIKLKDAKKIKILGKRWEYIV